MIPPPDCIPFPFASFSPLSTDVNVDSVPFFPTILATCCISLAYSALPTWNTLTFSLPIILCIFLVDSGTHLVYQPPNVELNVDFVWTDWNFGPSFNL